MSENSDKIKMQMDKMTLEDYKYEEPKESVGTKIKSIAKDILFWRFKFVAAILGVTEDNVSSSTKTKGHHGGHHGGGSSNSNSSGSTFRDTYHFDPSKAYMERIQEQAYFKMIDGKGDHDCDHEH